jgi:hypothetical protein
MIALALLVVLQQQPDSQPGLVRSPVAPLTVAPTSPIVTAGSSVRLSAAALDSSGKPIPGAAFVWSGHSFEGKVDEDGTVNGGAPGTLVATVVATVPGASPSKPMHFSVRIKPGSPTRVAITPAIPRLLVGQRLVLSGVPQAANGDHVDAPVRWTSSAPKVLEVRRDGSVAALAPGKAVVTAQAGAATSSMAVQVVANTVRRVEITGGATDARTGDVLDFRAVAKDAAGKTISGVTPVWSMSPGNGEIDVDGTFVANDAGDYRVTASFGTASADAAVHIRHRDVRRAATIVGRLPIAKLPTTEFWPHPNKRNAYLATLGDRMYALDISDPANPRITDSVLVDARVINDVMTTADGKYGVMTREGASSRRNGIVVLSFEDPAHPKPIAEYTETVTGGVHSTYVYTQAKYGTHVYLTDDATGSMRVIDLNDPPHPREIARWQVERSPAGRMLHDIDVRDGLAYLSYWNDGLVVLDVGNGVKGGSPEHPMLVSQYKYDLDDLYRNVEAEGGPGFIRGTHTAWRRGDYVFVGDEVFSARPLGIAFPGLSLGKANGRLHVIDVRDMSRPREVAYFEPTDGGTHNVWVAGDTLYLGDYQGGLRVLDISGELRGDLLAEDREIAHVHTGDARGVVPNAAMTWGAFYHNGLVWANDVFSGLWSIRLEPKETPPLAP